MTALQARPAPVGRHLREMASGAFLHALPADLVGSLVAQGFVLNPFTRPYVSQHGAVSVRLVWRCRTTPASLALNWTLRGGISDALMDAIDAAMTTELVTIDHA